jgi:hypothetical protein
MFLGEEREEGKKEAHWRQTRPLSETCATPTRKWHNDAVARVRRRGDRPPYSCVYVSRKYRETRNSCLLLVENRMESSPSILVTRNPN